MRSDLHRRHVIDVRELLDRQDQRGGAAAGDLPGDARHPAPRGRKKQSTGTYGHPAFMHARNPATMSGSLLPYTSTDEPGSTRRAMASANASEDAQSSPYVRCAPVETRTASASGRSSTVFSINSRYLMAISRCLVGRNPSASPPMARRAQKGSRTPRPVRRRRKEPTPPPTPIWQEGLRGPAHCAHCAPATLKQDLPHRDIAVRVVMNQ